MKQAHKKIAGRITTSWQESAGLDSRRLINGTIALLTIFVLVLSGQSVWQAWREHRAAREVAIANAMADALIEASGIQAVERGLTSIALGSLPFVNDPGYVSRIATLRRRGDHQWRLAMDMARRLEEKLPPDSEFADKLRRVREARAVLELARTRVDACMAGQACGIAAQSWIDTITRFISRSALLREVAFMPLDTPGHVVQINLALKRWVWMASESAGRERGILAYYLASGRLIPRDQVEELLSQRSMVERSVLDILALKELRHTDPRILSAIAGMERVFLGDYEITRNEAYVAAATGDAPFGADAWMAQSTRAIDSILAVAAAVTRVADEEAAEAMRASRVNLYWHALIAALAVGLALLGMTRVRRTTNALFQQKELAEVTLHSIGDAVITTDADARVDYLNPVAEKMTGWSTLEAKGRALAEVFNIVNGLTRAPEPSPIVACLRENRVVGLANSTLLIRRDGHEYAIEDSAAPIRDRSGMVMGGVLVFYDVAKSRQASHLLGYHASHDPVTGLINRREFERRLCEFRLRARDHGERHALCYLDLDQFKIVNDTCGHGAGDQLLKQLTARLGTRVRESDVLARLGGDEFGLLLASCPLERAQALAEQVRDIVAQTRFEWEGRSFDLHASIGLVSIGADSPEAGDLLAQADAACNVAKQKGRNRVQIYETGDLDMARRHGEMQWVSRLTHALEEDRFELYCQAIVPLGEGARHCEVLLRLMDEDGRIVAPGEFIPAAERYDLMPAIDRWVIRHALATLGRRVAAGLGMDGEVLAINVSGASLGEKDFEDFLRAEFDAHGVPLHRVCLEVTETAAVASLDQAAALIRSLRADGCRFALDDFGSGLSSFMYLKRLPVDYLKIDGSFVRTMIDDPVARATVQAIHTVGSAIGIRTIAEFVENDAILAQLREMGVDYAQGYGIGRPMPMADYFRAMED